MLGVTPMLMGAGAGGVLPQAVFATSLYTGTGAAQTITNGLDLAGQGGLTWIKSRSAVNDHNLIDTARGAPKRLVTDTLASEISPADGLTAFTATGFTLGADAGNSGVNPAGGGTFVAQSFRQATKFFQVVTYTGNGTAGRQIPHTLGVAPGMIVVKRRDASSSTGWVAYHKDVGFSNTLYLNTTAAQSAATTAVQAASATTFTVGTFTDVNFAGATYVAYLWAHDPDTVNGIVQCGSFTASSGGAATVSLGWRPQFLLVKVTGTTGSWNIVDTTRGWNGTDLVLKPNLTDAEITNSAAGAPTSDGFTVASSLNGIFPSAQHVYLAIRAPIS